MSIHHHHSSPLPHHTSEYVSSSNTSSATSLDSSTASTGASSPTSMHQIEYLVPDKAVSIIIGVGGQTMLEIQSSFSVQCQISRQNEKKESSDEMMRKVLLKGAPEKVQQARCRLEALVEQYYNRRK